VLGDRLDIRQNTSLSDIENTHQYILLTHLIFKFINIFIGSVLPPSKASFDGGREGGSSKSNSFKFVVFMSLSLSMSCSYIVMK